MTAFGEWRAPEQIVKLARLAILRRPGATVGPAVIAPEGTIALATRLVDVSSTEIRQRVRAGRSIRGFVPDSVAKFIETERLYR